MGSLAGTAQARAALRLVAAPARTDDPDALRRVELAHAALSNGAAAEATALLGRALERSRAVRAAAGGGEEADRLAAGVFTGDVLADLAAEGLLEADDVRVAGAVLAQVRDEPLLPATFDLFLRTVSSPVLRSLPPLVAAEIQLGLLLHLDVASTATLWRAGAGTVDCVLKLGSGEISRRTRAEAKAVIAGRPPLSALGRTTLRSTVVRRFGEPYGAVVVRTHAKTTHDVTAFLSEVAAVLAPVLEREALLDRNTKREGQLVSAAEKRLMRLGFDLHDGPIQDVLALGSDVRLLGEQVYPFIADSHRELAAGRFDDLLARIVEIDRSLRGVAHSLESKSVVSRPLGETLHREADDFAERTGITVQLDVRGDPDNLTPSQRIAVYRAIQESLANVREHSGADSVEITVRARRARTDVRIVDDGHGFEVSRALARAAHRGRLGLVGIAERIRMLGGTFDIESAPGGPTTLRLSLPRWEPFEPVDSDV